MKLLFDQNLSRHLPARLSDLFAGSAHVREFGMQNADDPRVWDHAAEHGFVIVSKDSDFYARSLVEGAPPKVIWVRTGNCPTAKIEQVIRQRKREITGFGDDPTASFLVIS